jgi:hypothetical protein
LRKARKTSPAEPVRDAAGASSMVVVRVVEDFTALLPRSLSTVADSAETVAKLAPGCLPKAA